MLALAFGLSYLELIIPLDMGIPGVKLGFANVVVMVLLYTNGPVDAISVSVLRVILTSVLFGSFFSFLFSLGGAAASFLVMLYARRYVSVPTTSMLGGVSHNIGQFLVGLLLIDNFNILFYLPLLIISGILTGLLTSIPAKAIISLINNNGSQT